MTVYSDTLKPSCKRAEVGRESEFNLIQGSIQTVYICIFVFTYGTISDVPAS